MKADAWILIAVLSTAGCSDETIGPDPAEFAELCGEVGPVQILALDPDRPLAATFAWQMLDGRRLLTINYLGEPSEQVFADLPPIGDREVWSVGPCGEDPLLLTSGAQRLFYVGGQDGSPEGWPELMLVCDEATGQISTLDPTGVRPSNVVFETGDCSVNTIDDGVLTLVPHDEESAALVVQHWPEDPWTMKAEPVVLHDSIRMPTSLSSAPHWGTTDDELLVITSADELVAISRLDGELTTVATDVYGFKHDSSGRYVFWQGNPDGSEGPIMFLDRETNEVTQLAEGALSQTGMNPFILEELDILHLWIEADQVQRFYRLPTLESIDVPRPINVLGPVDGTRVLVSDSFTTGHYWLMDTLTGEQTDLLDGPANLVRFDEDSISVIKGESVGPLWRVRFDGQAELLAHRVMEPLGLTTDGRIVTPVEVGADWTGSLIVVDPETLDEQEIDRDVLRSGFALEEIEGDPVVVYGVAHPERHGIWAARLAD